MDNFAIKYSKAATGLYRYYNYDLCIIILLVFKVLKKNLVLEMHQHVIQCSD